jgi:uncharacterized protein YbjT (DUF2867 family)
MRTAILFGASGNIGGHLLEILLRSERYKKVKIVTRKRLEIQHPKLTSLLADYHSLTTIKEQLNADDVFVIVGATDKNIERNYPVLIARLCKEQGAKTISVITAVGAAAKSVVSFTKLKGEIEEDILNLNYSKTHIFRPGMITGERQFYRSFEKTMMRIWKVIDPLLFGNLSKYKGMQAHKIALAMYFALDSYTEAVKVLHWKEMDGIIKKSDSL